MMRDAQYCSLIGGWQIGMRRLGEGSVLKENTCWLRAETVNSAPCLCIIAN